MSLTEVKKVGGEISFAAQLIIQLTFSQWADFSEKAGKGYFLHLLFSQCQCKPRSFFKCKPKKCVSFHRGLRILIECLLINIKKVRVTFHKTDENVMYYALRYLKCSKRFIRELLKNVKFEVELFSGKVGYTQWDTKIMHKLSVPTELSVADLSWIPLCPPKCCCRPLESDAKTVSMKETLARMESFLDPRNKHRIV